MHRSGTSVVSRVVNLLGVSLGEEAALLAAGPPNPRGFWENLTLTRLSELVLLAYGGSWDDPPILTDGWEEDDRLSPIYVQARAVMAPLLESGDLVGWKDPRSSLLLPFWRRVTPVDRTLLALRDPREVAGSLATRNGLGAERSAYLWLRYNVAAWRHDPDLRSVSYAELIDAPDPTITYLADAVGLPAPDPERRSQIAAEIVPELRHTHAVANGETMRMAVEYFDLCTRGSRANILAASEELNRRWAAVAVSDGHLRRARVATRSLVPAPARRRIRSKVGGVVSVPLRLATKRSPSPLPVVSPRPSVEGSLTQGTERQ